MRAVAEIDQWLRQHAGAGAHLTSDSRRVEAGDVFVAYRGARTDGRHFLADAAGRGAVAALVDPEGWQDGASAPIPVLTVDALKNQAGAIAAHWYGAPSRALWSVGVTGTSGKSSCALWIAQALASFGRHPIVAGTLGVGLLGALDDLNLTTPDPIQLQRTLRHLVDAGGDALAMEVSSIGLAEGRVNGMHYDVALFTNLSRDHLDYHGDMQRYEEAKVALFTWSGLGHAVVNLDDPAGVRVAERARAAGVAVTGYSAQGLRGADLRATRVCLGNEGMALEFSGGYGTRVVRTPFIGQHNVANLLGVLGVLLASGVAVDQAFAALSGLQPVPGRLERVPGAALEPLVLIDYAHKPDALEKVLEACQPIARARGGELVVVFGCGGDRDAGKRALMGAIAARLAQTVVITSDNPRSEDPAAIVAAIASGVPAGARHVRQEVDRRAAIRGAIAAAGVHDVIVIAGKGHETYQEIKGEKFTFSDFAEASVALKARQAVTS
jgi:UDP-N-acetylmuramoyl-L-alanyl-D-glutamate--2,6-diaminopimelate ligase